MNFKRLLISILSLTTVASMVAPTIVETSYSHSVYAETSASDFKYSINTTKGYVAINGYTGSDEDIVIPETIDGYPVTIIGDEAFYNVAYSIRTSIKSIQLPNTITLIGAGAFCDCKNLTSINIPDTVTSIGRWAFYGCSSLKEVTIPSGVTSIEFDTFRGCTDLETVTIKSPNTKINDTAFDGCYIVNIVYDYDDDITTTTIQTDNSYTYGTTTASSDFTYSGTATSYTTGVASNNNFVNGVYCDINGDGKVSTADLILIKKELLGL